MPVLKSVNTANLIELTTSKFQILLFFPNSPAGLPGLAMFLFQEDFLFSFARLKNTLTNKTNLATQSKDIVSIVFLLMIIQSVLCP